MPDSSFDGRAAVLALRSLSRPDLLIVAALGALGASSGTYVAVEVLAEAIGQNYDGLAKRLRRLDGGLLHYERSRKGAAPGRVTLRSPIAAPEAHGPPGDSIPGPAAPKPQSVPLSAKSISGGRAH